MSDNKFEPSEAAAPGRYRITITEKGPYLVYGRPSLTIERIRLGPRDAGPGFETGAHFEMRTDPTALCRCGASHRKPYCDGTHASTAWDPTLTAPLQPTTAGREVVEGATLTLEDHPRRCTQARFCQAEGDVRSLVGRSSDPDARQRAIHEAGLCPGGRLTARDRQSGEAFEIRYEPSLGLIEAPAAGVSGGLWLRGGIPFGREDGRAYATRNRVVLCRCGRSADKPFCDGTHATVKWHDGLDDATAAPERTAATAAGAKR